MPFESLLNFFVGLAMGIISVVAVYKLLAAYLKGNKVQKELGHFLLAGIIVCGIPLMTKSIPTVSEYLVTPCVDIVVYVSKEISQGVKVN